ncbi:MAG: hypothetical protein KGO21_00035 [Hyphomicrobiales bacterium]|nr:hypothetical protein [Hyphomicrobiales bacterium]
MAYESWQQLPYEKIYACDFEYFGDEADPKTPVCLVIRELRSGKVYRYWQDELLNLSKAPFSTGPKVLWIAYFSSAEWGMFLQLGWALPERIFDCFTEFVCETNGIEYPGGKSLLAALEYFGCHASSAEEKMSMRELILAGGPWSEYQKSSILDYCQSDVDALAQLFPRMIMKWVKDEQRLGQALLRGRYMAAASAIERNGIPIDVELLQNLKDNWDHIKQVLIAEVDQEHGVYENGSFKISNFEAYLATNKIPWPRLATGSLQLDRDTFKAQQLAYPQLKPLYDLRVTLDELKLNKLAVGKDGRNRVLLSPFRSKTGRNQPSTSRFIFGPSTWIRGLIKPSAGYSVAYLDWRSQEIAVAAARSGDIAMWEAYESGDPYMTFAIQAGLAPKGATKSTHKAVRDKCKVIVLGVQYGMTANGIARASGLLEAEAQDLIRRHRETYKTFWRWAENNASAALFGLPLQTCFGWKIQVGRGTDPKERTFLNWPMQANAAEMLRLACCLATEAGLKICAPIHDALLIEAPTERIHKDIEHLKDIMRTASEAVLGDGKFCGVDVQIVHYPDRYQDERGADMWTKIMRFLERLGVHSRN